MTFRDDEAFERDLFALRARALPAPTFDVDDVFARAERRATANSRRTSRMRSSIGRAGLWISAAACALLLVRGPGAVLLDAPPHAARGTAPALTADAFDAEFLACAAETTSPSVAACVAPRGDREAPVASFVCEHDVTFSSARP